MRRLGGQHRRGQQSKHTQHTTWVVCWVCLGLTIQAWSTHFYTTEILPNERLQMLVHVVRQPGSSCCEWDARGMSAFRGRTKDAPAGWTTSERAEYWNPRTKRRAVFGAVPVIPAEYNLTKRSQSNCPQTRMMMNACIANFDNFFEDRKWVFKTYQTLDGPSSRHKSSGTVNE